MWEGTSDVLGEGLSVRTFVIPIPAWTVPTHAAESASVNEFTRGTFTLAIGLGGYPSEGFRRQLGLPVLPPVGYTRAYLQTLRPLFTGDVVNYEGHGVSLHGVQLGFEAPRVPVYLAALGP